jgi:heat shock protein HslJ
VSHVAANRSAGAGPHPHPDRHRHRPPGPTTSAALASATLVSATLAAVLLTACAGPTAPGAGAGPEAAAVPEVLLGGWELISGRGPDGEVVPQDGHAITLDIDRRAWGGSGGCNRYSGSVTVVGDELTMLEVAVTSMACMEDGVMEAEAAYLAAFTAVDRWDLDGDRLTLTGPEAQLEFTRAVPLADAPLLGTTWQLAELISGDGPDAAVSSVWTDAELVLGEDGRLSGSTGCNRMMGGFERDGEVLVLEPLATTRMACTDDSAAEQERQVLAVFDASALMVELEGDRLVLRAPDGSALGYRAG